MTRNDVRDRAIWCGPGYATEHSGAWTARLMHQTKLALYANGDSPARAFDALADRLRAIADELDDGGELYLEPLHPSNRGTSP